MKKNFILLISALLLSLTGNAQNVKSITITKGDTLVLQGDTIAIKGNPKVIIMKASELNKTAQILQFRMDSLQQLFLDKDKLMKDLEAVNNLLSGKNESGSYFIFNDGMDWKKHDSVMKMLHFKSKKLNDSILKTVKTSQLKNSKMIDSIAKTFWKDKGKFDDFIKKIQEQSAFLQEQNMKSVDAIIKQNMKLTDSIIKNNGAIIINLNDSTLFNNIKIFDLRVDSLKIKLQDKGIIIQ